MSELDRRAAEAASRLRHEVATDLDLDAALDRVSAGAGPRRTRTAALRVGVMVLVAGVAMAAVVAVQAGGTTDDVDRAVEDRDGIISSPDGANEGVIADDGITERGAAILGGLPDGPLDGRESWRLPVVSDPRTELTDGQMVTLYGRGFEPGELVGAVHCASEADASSMGVGACDLGEGFSNTTTTSARSDGSVVVQVVLRRYITTPELGQVDCTTAAERCLLAIGASSNYDRSGGAYVSFAGSPPFADPGLVVDPAGPYAPGQEVAVTATGLVAGRQSQVMQCVGDDHCATVASGRVADDGTFAATVVVGSSVDVDGDVQPCDGSCQLVVNGVGLADFTSAPVPPPWPLELTDGDVVVGGEVGAAASPASPGSAQPPSTEPPTTGPPSSAVPPSTELPPSTEAPSVTAGSATTGPPATASAGG